MMIQTFETYFSTIKKLPFSEITEHSLRTPFESFLITIAQEINPRIKIIHEGKGSANFGRPDFVVHLQGQHIGYIETKKLGENLDKILTSEQIEKYKELSDNIILTNYLDFIWIKNKEVQKISTLAYIEDAKNKKTSLNTDNINQVNELMSSFFSTTPQKIKNPKKLAKELAIRTKILKDFLYLNLKNSTEGLLADLYAIFRKYIFTGLSINDFADAFAQNLTYSLFLAKLNAGDTIVGLQNINDYVSHSFELIRELVGFLKELERDNYLEIKWVVEEIITIMNGVDIPSIKQSLSFDNSNKDSFIYFYEDFLAFYDPTLRRSKGVYYTPPEVVNFIIRSIQQVLTETFQIPKGLANQQVTVLDFATGTGTFLVEILEQILAFIDTKDHKQVIKNHILKNIFGFEFLIAPYTVAHLKLSQYLKEKAQYQLEDSERFQIFLTNTLEPNSNQVAIPSLPALGIESKNAQVVKDNPILVIIGNPPYSVISQNPSEKAIKVQKGEQFIKDYTWQKGKLGYVLGVAKKDKEMMQKTWIGEKIEWYKYVDGKHFEETKHSLQDDYVKFMRFAQWKMEQVGEGVIGIITNHSFLDNPTFRGMRQNLINTFDQLYFIDLHGNSTKKEKNPDGQKDENIFDIAQGVAISIMIKKKGLPKGVYRADAWGNREDKNKLLQKSDFSTMQWEEITPKSPFYFFFNQKQNTETYQKWYAIDAIFTLNSMGITSSRDSFIIDIERDRLEKRLLDFKNLDISNSDIRNKYELKDTRGWLLKEARIQLGKLKDFDKFFLPISYRPFDDRVIFYHRIMVDWGRWEVMQHLQKENIALCLVRIGRDIYAPNYFITNKLTDKSILSSLDNANIFPLYRYQEVTQNSLFSPQKQFNTALQEAKKYKRSADAYAKKANALLQQAKLLNEKNWDEVQDALSEEKDAVMEEYHAVLDMQDHLLEKKQEAISNKSESVYEKLPNFTKEFQNFIKEKYKTEISPEEIMGYLYAILYSKTYRGKYAEFLKIDYPKIPFIDDFTLFKKLADLGLKIIDAHLFNSLPSYEIGKLEGEGNDKIEKIYWENNNMYINQNQYFSQVSETLWNFQIGGYKVLEKYLKERKHQSMNNNEKAHFVKVIHVLQFTEEQMVKIDDVISNWI